MGLKIYYFLWLQQHVILFLGVAIKFLVSVPLNIPPQTSTIASHLPKALGAALSITRAKELGITGNLACGFSDSLLFW